MSITGCSEGLVQLPELGDLERGDTVEAGGVNKGVSNDENKLLSLPISAARELRGGKLKTESSGGDPNVFMFMYVLFMYPLNRGECAGGVSNASNEYGDAAPFMAGDWLVDE